MALGLWGGVVDSVCPRLVSHPIIYKQHEWLTVQCGFALIYWISALLVCSMLPLKAQNGWHHCNRCKCCLHCLLCWALLCWRKSHTVGNVGPSHRLLTMVALGNKHKAILCWLCVFSNHAHSFAMLLPLLSTLAPLPIQAAFKISCAECLNYKLYECTAL